MRFEPAPPSDVVNGQYGPPRERKGAALPQRYVQNALWRPPQRSSALRHSALERSRAPPGAAPRCAATCCALTQPYVVPLCPDTTLRCAPASPSTVPLHSPVQRPSPGPPSASASPQTAPLRIPANRIVDVRLRPVAFSAQPPGPPQPDAASPARHSQRPAIHVAWPAQAHCGPPSAPAPARLRGTRAERPPPPPRPPPRGPDPAAATPAAGREAMLRPRPVGHATLADDATPASPRALPPATRSPLPATGVRSATRADRT